MDEVADLDEFRLRRSAKAGDLNVAVCMYCGAEYPWGLRLDHDCQKSSRENHPSSRP